MLFLILKRFLKFVKNIKENKAYEEEHKKGGRPSVLSVLDKLIVMLEYYREYRTMEHIAFDYDTNKLEIVKICHEKSLDYSTIALALAQGMSKENKTKIIDEKDLMKIFE